jgi:hypothetical protein
MTVLEQKFHGPVQMLRTEHAKWDALPQQWQPPSHTTVARYLRGGQISEYGNWTERIVSMRLEANADFQPSNIVRREILYFSSPHDS